MAIYPYPTHLTQHWSLADGAVITRRAIRQEDANIERAFVHALSNESKYFRFRRNDCARRTAALL
ncbi:MAG: hypothetical protein ACREUQ_11370 [Burkholderiales bacterium]